MDDYIKRQEALDAVQDILNDPNCPLFIAATIEQILTDLPAANVHEDVRGTPILRYRPERYERYEEQGLNENGEMLYLKRVLVDENSSAMYCSYCGKRLCSRFRSFCPNCGARMVKK